MISGLAIAVYLLVPGLGWLWCCSDNLCDNNTPLIRGLISFAVCLAAGLLINLLWTWFLLETGWLKLWTLTGGMAAVSATGCIIYRARRHAQASSVPKGIWPVVFVFCVMCALLMTFPPRGEWLAGGWDPGVYMNQGIHAAQQGGWRGEAMPAHADLVREDFNPFIRTIAGRDEMFPGIPIASDTGALRLTFYPMTPTWVAFLFTLGGPQAALHAMSWLGLILVFLLLGGLLRAGASLALTLVATALVVFHPLLIYHARTPSSEMLETVFVVMLLIALSRSNTRSTPLFLALILLAGILNRPTFLIWSALLFPLLGVRRDLNLTSCLLLTLPVVGGIVYYVTIGSAAVDRIAHLFPRLAWASIAVIPLSYATARVLPRRVWAYTAPLLFTLAPPLILSGMAIIHPSLFTELKSNVLKLCPYLGYPLILIGAFGIAYRFFAVWKDRRMTALDAWLWLCLCAAIIPFTFKFVAELYPWATKRFLSSVLPALGCGAAFALALPSRYATSYRRAWAWIPMGIGLAFVLWGHGVRLRDAWRNTEYDGLFDQLHTISAALEPNDIVLADHFLWGTPLAMVFQHQTLNGERLWARESEYRTSAALGFLREQQKRGRRVFILTGTEYGMDVFPEALHDAQLFQEFAPYTYHTIAHHRNGTGFPLRERTTIFRLYLLMSNP